MLKSFLQFPPARSLACITIGRANMDLYPPLGQKLSQSRSYEAFVGGSPANIAAGIVRRGLKAGIITKVADDGIGHFVLNYLQGFGIDVSQAKLETSLTRTSLAFAERRCNAQSVFYRQNPSDLHLSAEDITPDYISSAQVFFLSGAAVSQEPCRSAVQAAIDAAKQAGTVVAMDIDYRPHGWESLEKASQILQSFALQCDLLIGTADEYRIAANSSDTTAESVAQEDSEFLQLFPQVQLLVVKRSKDGANAYLCDGTCLAGALLPAALKKPWGAGDAFASSLLASLLLGKGLKDAMFDAAAAASLNISGTSCTEAMPSSEELADFLERYANGKLGAEWID